MTWTIRAGRIDEIDRLVALRRTLFEGIGYTDRGTLDRVCGASRDYFAERMPTGTFRVWVAAVNDEPIGSIGLVVHSVPPSPANLAGREGYIMNLVTLPDWRRRGIARALLTHVLDILRAERVPVASLHASSDGRELYKDLGFTTDNGLPEMRIRL